MKKNEHLPIFIGFLLVATSLVSCGGKNADSNSGPWDNLGGETIGDSQSSADMDDIDYLVTKGTEITDAIDENQKDTDDSTATAIEYTGKKITIKEPGDYKLTGEIGKQIEVTSAGVKLFLAGTSISNIGKKVINSDEDLIIVLVANTANEIINTGDGEEANAISVSGKLTINGSGKLTIDATKSAIKADGAFYSLGGELVLNAGTGHGISADSIILTSGNITVNSAEKDGLHAETEDDVLIKDPTFKRNRGYVFINFGVNVIINGVYGDGIQADTFAFISGGNISIKTLPTFISAKNNESLFKLVDGVYTRIAGEDAKNYANYYQLSQSNKGIKVGEIDYEDEDGNEHIITEDTEYSLLIDQGYLTIDSTDNGLHSNSGDLLIREGNITIKTAEHGLNADNNLKIRGGNITVTESYEGIEAETVEIAGGTVKISAIDDGINASSEASTAVQKTKSYIKISGGKTYVNASGDGIDSNGGILISGGELYVYGPTSGRDGSLDSETGIIITGGKLVAVGSNGMVETPSTNSTQYVVALNLSASASGKVEIKDGNTSLASFDPNTVFGVNKNYQSVVVSLPSFAKSKSYSVITGSKTTNVTITSIITKIGQSVGPGGPR